MAGQEALIPARQCETFEDVDVTGRDVLLLVC